MGGKGGREEREERNKTQVRSKANYVLKNLISKHDQTLESIREMTEHLLPLGIGVHHGGLLPFLRKRTESLFQAGLVRVLYHDVPTCYQTVLRCTNIYPGLHDLPVPPLLSSAEPVAGPQPHAGAMPQGDALRLDNERLRQENEQQRRTIEQLTRQLREQREAAAGAGRRKPPAQGGGRATAQHPGGVDWIREFLQCGAVGKGIPVNMINHSSCSSRNANHNLRRGSSSKLDDMWLCVCASLRLHHHKCLT